MALTQGMTNSFLLQLGLAVHNFAADDGDTFKIALYDSTATLGPDTTVYTATGEISGSAYSAGGMALTRVQPVVSDGVLIIDFANPTWTGTALTARGALIYNSSKSNKSVAVLDFGANKTMTNFTIQFPPATSEAAVLRIRLSTL
jgi:hypothetical protein